MATSSLVSHTILVALLDVAGHTTRTSTTTTTIINIPLSESLVTIIFTTSTGSAAATGYLPEEHIPRERTTTHVGVISSAPPRDRDSPPSIGQPQPTTGPQPLHHSTRQSPVSPSSPPGTLPPAQVSAGTLAPTSGAPMHHRVHHHHVHHHHHHVHHHHASHRVPLSPNGNVVSVPTPSGTPPSMVSPV
eukprot:CAMPEP_0176474010 /NCGR_PEP_ID=MMETSP0127-20121128/42699_1 /TAXON_ID=938130 /ORGANISM="Platyophrya macrostoma, Strain WH" /LENGTH=188 /DNA_ID=CAMNT_0017869219 /DNA_START=57 /DNA_END=619 /DNA_ORIENTATION=+